MKIKNTGFFLMEGLVALGIFSIFLSLTLPLIKTSLKLKTIVKREAKYNRNFYFLMDDIQNEIKNSSKVYLSKDKKCLTIEKYYDYDFKKMKINYCFKDFLWSKEFTRTIQTKDTKFKEELLFRNIKGRFFIEDGFIKMRMKVQKNREEEYIWK